MPPQLQFSHNPSLQQAWYALQVGLLLLPFSPFLAGLAIVTASLLTWKQHNYQIGRWLLAWGFAVLSVWLTITTAFAAEPIPALLGLFNFLPYFWVFVTLSALIQTPLQLRRLAWILVLTSLPVALIGCGQLFWGWSGRVEILDVVVNLRVDAGGNPPDRMASILSYANLYANYLVVILMLTFGLWFETYRTWLQQLSWVKAQPRALLVRLAVLSAAGVTNGAALVFANSRNAWAIAVLGCLAFALYQGWRWLLPVVAVPVGSILWAAFGRPPTRSWFRAIIPAFFWARLSDELYPDRPLAQLRSTQWRFAWSLTVEHPWTGWGLRSFSPLYEAQMNYWVGHPHNLFLMLTAEAGIPAAVLLFSLVGWVVFRGVQHLRQWTLADKPATDQAYPDLLARKNERLIFFSYLVAFLASALFSTLDVTLFDARLNLLGWVLLAGILGVVQREH